MVAGAPATQTHSVLTSTNWPAVMKIYAAGGCKFLCGHDSVTSLCHAVLQLLEAAHLSGEQQRSLMQHRQAYLHMKAQLVQRANQFKAGFRLSSPSALCQVLILQQLTTAALHDLRSRSACT